MPVLGRGACNGHPDMPGTGEPPYNTNDDTNLSNITRELPSKFFKITHKFSSFPFAAVSCAASPSLQLPQPHCPNKCGGPEACGAHAYCECGSGLCVCEAGYSGEGCTVDVCAEARCGPHGQCSARYLGGSIPVVEGACVCQSGQHACACERACACVHVYSFGRGSVGAGVRPCVSANR